MACPAAVFVVHSRVYDQSHGRPHFVLTFRNARRSHRRGQFVTWQLPVKCPARLMADRYQRVQERRTPVVFEEICCREAELARPLASMLHSRGTWVMENLSERVSLQQIQCRE